MLDTRTFGKTLVAKRPRRRIYKSELKYKTTLKHSLTNPVTEHYDQGFSMNNMGDNKQYLVSWYSVAVEMTPTITDNMLASSSGAVITSVSTNQEIFFDHISSCLTGRNNAGHPCQVKIYKCMPRRDILQSHQAITGANPLMFQQGFADMGVESKATFAQAYNLPSATPYGSGQWCSMFKVKLILSKTVEPGEQIRLNYKRKVGYPVKKSQYGLPTSGSHAGLYRHMKRCGPLYLIRVQGCVTHDESLVAYPLADTDLHATWGLYNMDWILEKWAVYRAPFVGPTRLAGDYETASHTFTKANDGLFTTENPNEAPPTA